MKQLILFILLLTFFSCQKKESATNSIDAENLNQEQIDSVLSEFKFYYDTPIIVDSSNQVLIPISTRLIEDKRYSSSYKDDYSSSHWNILFYNRKTGKNRLLSENKLRISNIYIKPDEYERGNKIIPRKILYEISDIDYNADNQLNYKDPEYLFISEIDGTNLTRISPANEHLQYFEVIPKTQQILFSTLRDINQDSLFDNDEDEYIWYKTEFVNNKWELSEMIDANQRKHIESLYFEQWLKKQ